MLNKEYLKLPDCYTWLLPTVYILFSLLVIGPVYYYGQMFSDQLKAIFSSMGADLPPITLLVQFVYPYSFILNLVTAGCAIGFYIVLSQGRLHRFAFSLLNLCLVSCILWSSFAIFALNLPVIQLLKIH